ncbi:MAG: flavodoxin family protein [Defluviitaleaceae bacterium]|nr:flavodoxin family protein [Defluviitaleaceae bacterium]
MKVILVNGSPHEKGCTYTALSEAAKTLNEEGIATSFFWVGVKPVSGCIACGLCSKLGCCSINDSVNVFLEAAEDADGFIFGTPVHYAAASGAITSFMDRAFYAAKGGPGGQFYMKPAAAVISARRAGTTAAFDQMNKYFTIAQMPVASSRYWNMVHGTRPEDVLEDGEGLYTMRVLGRNMAYLLKCLEAGRNAGVALPVEETPVRTNFIR